MSKISHAFLYIPIFRELVPISRDSRGKWSIDDVPSVTYQALGHDRFTAWKNEVMEFVDAGRITGLPEGLAFELLAAPNPEADWLTLQAFGGETLQILAKGGPDVVAQLRGAAVSLGLGHTDAAGAFVQGPPPKDS